MDTERLREYLTVVNAQSMTRAAGLLNISQPTLSKHIAELERGFGVPLLERLPGGVRATCAGNVLYNGAADIVHRVNELRRSMEEVKDVRWQPVNVACYVGYAPTDDMLAAASEQLPATVPGALVNVVDLCSYQGNCLVDLERGELDVCLTAAPGDLAGHNAVAQTPLLTDRLVLVVRNDSPLAGKQRVSVADMAGEVLWLPNNPGQPYVDAMWALLTRRGLSPTPYVSESAPGTPRTNAFNVSRGGCALSLRAMNAQLIPRIQRRSYTTLAIDDPDFELTVSALYRKDHAPAVQAFVEALTAAARELDMGEY